MQSYGIQHARWKQEFYSLKGVTKKIFIPKGDKPAEVPLRALAMHMHTQVMHKWAGTRTCMHAHTLVMCVAYGCAWAHYGHAHTSVMWVQWARIHKHVGILGRIWVGDGRALWAHMSALEHAHVVCLDAQMRLHTLCTQSHAQGKASTHKTERKTHTSCKWACTCNTLTLRHYHAHIMGAQ